MHSLAKKERENYATAKISLKSLLNLFTKIISTSLNACTALAFCSGDVFTKNNIGIKNKFLAR
jgi:hypothetical protein